jgi:hypothetical protein
VPEIPSPAEMQQTSAKMKNQTKLFNLSLLPIDDKAPDQATVFFCGQPFLAQCANFWINRLSKDPPVIEVTGGF